MSGSYDSALETHTEWGIRYTMPNGRSWFAGAFEDEARRRAAAVQLNGSIVELFSRTVTTRYGKWRKQP